eukprot:1676212-Amphidinium_carterae.1
MAKLVFKYVLFANSLGRLITHKDGSVVRDWPDRKGGYFGDAIALIARLFFKGSRSTRSQGNLCDRPDPKGVLLGFAIALIARVFITSGANSKHNGGFCEYRSNFKVAGRSPKCSRSLD